MFNKLFDYIIKVIFYISAPFVYFYLLIYIVIYVCMIKYQNRKKEKKRFLDIIITRIKNFYNKFKY